MNVVLLVAFVLAGTSYAYIIYWCWKGWDQTPVWKIPDNWVPATKVSLLIPARNEETVITNCLHAVFQQRYPAHLLEVIVINDHSEDQTAQMVGRMKRENLKLIHLTDSEGSKKKALQAGIEEASGTLIVTTDADCIMGKDWLVALVSFYEYTGARLIAGPVNFHKEKNVFQNFQSLDYIGMMGVTAAGFYHNTLSLCNGANLAYTKAAFEDVGGFHQIDSIASGDDMLLLEKFRKKNPHGLHFLKCAEACVYSMAETDLSGFFRQRIRWATKTSYYQNGRNIFVQAVVFGISALTLLSLLLIPVLGHQAAWLFAGLLVVKSIVDYVYLNRLCQFFGRADLMRSFWLSQIFYVFYLTAIGIWSFLAKDLEWKGRRLKV